MDLVTGVAVYVVVWWVMLFTVLPWGAVPGENPPPGTEPSAPAKPRLARKFLITSMLAALVWLGLYLIINSDLIHWRDG